MTILVSKRSTQPNSSFEREKITITDLNHLRFTPEEMKRPVVFDVDHSWRVFGLAHDLPDGLWMYGLSGNTPLKLVKRRIKGLTFKSSWIAEVQVDLQDAAACINFIIAQPSFVHGNPLPRYFDDSLLLTSLQSTEQAHQLHSFTIIIMGELLAFINQWRLTIGMNWASNFPAFVRSFLRRVQIMELPVRGGIFDAEEKVHRFFINRSIRTGCPTFLLNMGSLSHSQKSGPIPLEAGEIPDLQPILEDLHDTDSNLQPIQHIHTTNLPLFIHQQADVQLDIRDWRPIPVPKRLRLIMRWIYKPRLLQYFGSNSRVLIGLQYHQQFEWTDGNPWSVEARTKLGPAKLNGLLDDIESLVERHAPLFSPLAGMSKSTPGLRFPFAHFLPPISFSTILSSSEESVHLSRTRADEGRRHSSEEVESLTGLTYPFDRVALGENLPTPGPILAASLLPHNVPRLEVPIEVPSEIPSILEVFGSPSTRNSPTDLTRNSHLSPVRSISLQRVSPYSLNDPGRLLRRSSPSTGTTVETQSSPPSWSPAGKTDAASSLISQVFNEISCSHPEIGDSDAPYGGGKSTPWTFYYDVTNWQKDCTAVYATYPLRANIHPRWSTLLLQHGWLIVDGHTSAILKAAINVSPRGFSDSAGVLDYCVTHNLEFYVAVPDETLNIFRKDLYSFPPCIRESSFLLHQPGWYLHKAHEVLDRVNAGAFIMEGGVLAFFAKHLGGPRVVERMMEGPSVVANQFLKVHVHLPKPHEPPINLVRDQVTAGEQRALYGFIEQFDSISRSLLPTNFRGNGNTNSGTRLGN
ncbi:hypothetical protein EV421DRAFT_1908574 [Armillaria borealis]|uniref:Uncharacterized protein n=1 Tax=Armillaria borealis TaxID=47425 RepID=A0AA39MJB1_9AGAR|nr:hypothetical protein EV421DRAFT_1908574 [Armillaria borealis]